MGFKNWNPNRVYIPLLKFLFKKEEIRDKIIDEINLEKSEIRYLSMG